MNFAKNVKEEILNKPIKDKCCKKAFLAGLMRGNGKLFEKDGELGLDFYVFSEQTAMLVGDYLSYLYRYELREISVLRGGRGDKEKFVLTISGENAAEILYDLGILKDEDGETVVSLNMFEKIAEKECCLRSFFKGLFVSIGNCTVPTEDNSLNTGYHLELVFSHSAPAESANEKLAIFGVNAKITRRKDKFIVYIKSAEEIKNFIAFLGAPISVLKLTDYMINREVANNSNRQANCDLGNVTRQIEATEKQLSAIKKLRQSGEYENLKPDLKETADFRERYDGDTLSELAERMNVTKSCLNHRLRKLVKIANEINGAKDV